MIFTQQRLEEICPTFANPESYTFERIAPSLEYLYRTIFLDKSFLPSELADVIEKSFTREMEDFLYPEACARILPQLDLIATENGFGVVANDHIAPASPHRVKALIVSLERQAAIAWSHLFSAMLANDDFCESEYARIFYSCLIPTPQVAENFGIIGEEHMPTSLSNYYKITPLVESAQAELRAILSPELTNTLCLMQRNVVDFSEVKKIAYTELLKKSRLYIAAYFLDKGSIPTLAKELRHFLHEKGEAIFTEYFHSSTYSALNSSLTHPDNSKHTHAYTF